VATLITAIQCPRCGSTQKTELRPGDFRCDSCGTEYFLDNGTVIGRQGTTNSISPINQKRVNPASIAMGIGVVIILITTTLILTISSSTEKTSTASYVPTPASPAEDPAYWSNSESHLYLSSDHRPVLLTFGTKIHHDHPEKNASYVSFTDVSDGTELKRVPVPSPAATSASESPAEFSLREFANGDIYIIANNTLLYRIQKTAYAIKDVTKTLFENQKELVSGIAKIDYVYPNLGEGFNLMTNDGKTFFYYPVTDKLYTEQTVYTERLDAKIPAADSTEKTGFSFSVPYIDATDASQQLIKFQYRDAKNAPSREFAHYSGYKWDDPQILKEQGILSYKDFTPGRTYFGYQLLYAGDDYVLFSYLISPARGASRNLQCLDAHTAAIVFTTRLDADKSPTACVRYKDGFALAAIPDMYTLDLHGKLTKRIPAMYKND
jgi:hypothetical protein